ncbi:MAG: hypothetical protein P4L46_13030 [Fimbriimonas sp.]|nr:hypothetical protein [Fimbriimonas sp.]
MLLALSSLVVIRAGYGQIEGLPKFDFKPAVMVGQREIVLGPLVQPDTVMEVRYDNDVPAEFGKGPIAPPSSFVYSKGYVRWSVTDGMLFNKSCRILKSEGLTKGEIILRTRRVPYACTYRESYWILPDGKLLRQSAEQEDPYGKRHAEAVFWPDHIDVSVVDSKHTKSFSMYPNVDMKLLDAQFKPMVDSGKIITDLKEYYTFDPFTQGFTKYKATVTGTFHGSWLATKFEGPHIEIDGPKQTQMVYVSKENDLIKVDLPDHLSIVLDFLPRDRDPLYQMSTGKKGGSQ